MKHPKGRTRRHEHHPRIYFILSGFLVFLGLLFLWTTTIKIPDLKSIEERHITESTKIYDRSGEILLYDIHQDIQRTVIPFEGISRNVKNATIAIEDSDFYKHKGVRPLAILRAILVNITSFGFSQGGSTITQQVVKNSILTTDKTITRKLKEWILAFKLERILTKEQIFSLYLNESPYGGNLYGVEEASRAFFGKSSHDVTLAEAAYLAALPQAPTYYSPYGNHRDRLDERKNLVLKRMKNLGFITDSEYEAALAEVAVFAPQAEKGIKAPHFVFFVKEYLENKYGKDMVEKGGLRVITTLDYGLEQKALEAIGEFAESNEKNFNAKNESLVAIDPKTGQILVMVGSRDYFDTEHEGNFNVALAHRQPGSAFKPFAYATAFSRGYTPDTMLFDVKTQFNTRCDSDGNPKYPNIKPEDCYMPVNYDGIYRGPISMRNALAQSINIPSLKTLYLAGLQDTQNTATRMGITSLSDINRYGLTLVLGGGEVSLLELTNAYGVFANEGIKNPYSGILKVEDKNGNVLEEWKPEPSEAITEFVSDEISDVLSDNNARAPAFGDRSALYFLNHSVAVKTGTTNDYRDAWIVGYTPSLVVGAWAGNNDNSPMEKKVAGFIIAPLWHRFMEEALKTVPVESFKKPDYNYNKNINPVLRGFWKGGKSYFVDTITGKLATEYTPGETREERVITQIHSILYWINKDNPLGSSPKHPEDDPQFLLWETPVRNWARDQKVIEETETVIPPETDTIHTPQNAPLLSLSGITHNFSYNGNDHITVMITSQGVLSLARVDMYINNVYISTISKSPFIFTFTPKNIANIKDTNVIKFIGYDNAMNKGEVGETFLVSN